MERDVVYDAVRAICMLWIVGFWHFGNYLPEAYQYSEALLHIGEIITLGVLATFAFISGLFLSRYKFDCIGDVLYFYKKRITRFFFLFFLAVISMYIAGLLFHQHFFESLKQVVLCLLGLGSFYTPFVRTFWYISMMMFFYLITPLLLYPHNILFKLANSTLLVLLLIIVSYFNFIEVDERLIVFLVFYCAGLLIPKKNVDQLKKVYFLAAAILVLLFPVNTIWQGIITDVLIFIFLVSFANLLCKLRLNKVLSWISYSSMSAYLFHRHIMLSFVFLFSLIFGTSLGEAFIPLWSVIIVIPTVFVFSYFIQKCYDIMYKRIERNENRTIIKKA